MKFDDLQKAWKNQPADMRITIDPALLLQEVKRNKRDFEITIFWRDFREVAIAVVLAVFFFYFGLHGGWPPFLLAVMCLFVAGYLVCDRIRQRRKRRDIPDTLRGTIESSMQQVKHQIWLLKNVFWWYLLPFSIGLAALVGSAYWDTVRDYDPDYAPKTLLFLGIYAAFVVLLYWGIYHLNQWGVRKELLPRKRELENLLETLTEDNELQD